MKGKIKDESKTKIIGKFVGLKSKMYSMKNIDVKESNTEKGVKLQLSLINLKTLYLIKKVLRHKMKTIRGKNHKLGRYEINKISLSCLDHKIFVLDDEIHTLTYRLKKPQIRKILIRKKRFSTT